MLSICSSLLQPTPTCYSMLQPANRSFKMLKINRLLVGGSMPQVAIRGKQMGKAMSRVKATTLDVNDMGQAELAKGNATLLDENSPVAGVTNIAQDFRGSEWKGSTDDDGTTAAKTIVWTNGTIWNYTPAMIETVDNENDKMDWSGVAVGGYSPSVPNEGRNHIVFRHEGSTEDPDGSKGGVVYFGKSTASSKVDDLAWLVAWYTPPYDGAPPKVYGECGPITKYRKLNWDAIEDKLKNASTLIYYEDPATRAHIAGGIYQASGHPYLVVQFSVIVR